MAGGCTENPRLWLNSGLPNPNGWVGRGYTDHSLRLGDRRVRRVHRQLQGCRIVRPCDFPGHGGLENVGLPPALQAFCMASRTRDPGLYDNGRGVSGSWDGNTGRAPGRLS